MRPLSLAIVGADYQNKRGPARRFDLALCKPGDPIELRPEPTNKKDPYAVAVYSDRQVQLGYVTAERAPYIGKIIGEGREVRCVFQGPAAFGGWVRCAFDGDEPVLPPARPDAAQAPAGAGDPDSGFWPDEIWPDS